MKINTNFKYISFDIFDTLIIRDVLTPKDVFKIVAINLKKKGISQIDNFYGKRIDAEKRAISQNRKSEEVSLKEIYANIPFDSEEERIIAYQEEINTELLVCKPNMPFVDMISKLKNEGKIIVITSDMYLPRDIISQILGHCHIKYDYLFVSSEIGVRKSSGKLFKYILSSLKINRKEIIHIGDNLQSDYIVPKLIGISSIRYKRERPLFIDSVVDSQNIVSKIIQAVKINGSAGKNAYYQIGHNYLGPLLVGFCQWIKRENSIQGKCLNLLFLARDGYIMQKAYNILYPASINEYAYMSRRSLTVPLLVNAESWKDVVDIVGYIKREETWKDIFHKIGIDGHDALLSNVENRYGRVITKKELLSGEYDDVFVEIRDALHRNAECEMREAKRYLDKILKKKTAIVDIGWYGTMQRTLKSLREDIDIKGYYLGIIKKEGYNTLDAKGYIYDYIYGSTYDEKLIYGFNGLIESFFTANHGSCKKYNKGEPILEEWELGNWAIIEKIHDGALDFCRRISPYLANEEELSRNEAYSQIHRLMTKPKSKEISLLGKIIFYDTYFELLIKHSKWHYMAHPFEVFHDLMSSNWKIAFIKNLLSVDFADKIYLMIMKFK